MSTDDATPSPTPATVAGPGTDMDRRDDDRAASLPPRPVLTDGVVLLRAPVASDTEALVAGAGQESVARFTRVPSPYTAAEATAFVHLATAGWADASVAAFAVCRASRPSALLGMVGLHDLDLSGRPGGAAELGYWLAEEARGRGLMTRAARLLCAWAFDELGLARIDWQAKVGNDASRLVAEAIGVQVEGVARRGGLLRGERADTWFGGLLPEDLVREPVP